MAKLQITKSTKIYVASPGNVATGGPELLHQLVYELNKLGKSAYMLYYKKTENNPVHEAYKHYKNPYVDSIEDVEDNILIVPEVVTDLLYNYRNIQKIIWWLSVDNYYKRFNSNNMIKQIIKKILYSLGYFNVYKFDKKESIFHFVQSEYAKQHLLSKGIMEIQFLGDYLNKHFIENQSNNINSHKKNIVVYNPKKGIEFTKKLINLANDIKFVPIENMTREEVAELLSSAKVYIDFGNHPGKDRIPREAAISGCCVITGKQGSSKYYEDVAIEDEFKFDDSEKEIPKIIKKIKDIFNDYELNSNKFDFYREKIKNEQLEFINDIKKIF